MVVAIKVVTPLTRAAEIQYSITDLSHSPSDVPPIGVIAFFFNSTGGAVPSSIMTLLVSLSPLSTSTKCQWPARRSSILIWERPPPLFPSTFFFFFPFLLKQLLVLRHVPGSPGFKVSGILKKFTLGEI